MRSRKRMIENCPVRTGMRFGSARSLSFDTEHLLEGVFDVD